MKSASDTINFMKHVISLEIKSYIADISTLTKSPVLKKLSYSFYYYNNMWAQQLFLVFFTSTFCIKCVYGNNYATVSVVDSNYTTIPSLRSDDTTHLSVNSTFELTLLSNNLSGRIVNGTAAFLGQFPQQVSLRRRYSQTHFCGGNIITSKWVLTAGHCMFAIKTGELLEPYTIIIVAGEVALKHTSYARQWSYVSKLIVHPDYDKETLRNDVALLKLLKPFTLDEYAAPAPFAKIPMKPGTVCQVSGWGYQKYEEPILSGKLLFIDVPLMDKSLCQKLLENITDINEGQICAGYMEGQRDACRGDSGGGLICEGFLTGIVSNGYNCALPLIPGWYSDVKFYTPWIRKYVNQSDMDYRIRMVHDNSAGDTLSLSTFLLSFIAVIYTLFVFNQENK